MQGLLAQKMAKGQPGQQPGQQPMQQQGGQRPQGGQPQDRRQPAEQGNDETVNVNPEKAQEQVSAATNSMLKALYGSGLDTAKDTLKRNAEQPDVGVGKVVGKMMTTTYQALADNGKTIPPGIMVRAGMTAAKAVGELAERMRVVQPEQTKNAVEAGFMVGMAEFGQASKGVMNKAQRQRYAQMIQAMSQAREEAQGGRQQQGQPQGGGSQRQAPQRQPQQPGPNKPAGGMMQ